MSGFSTSRMPKKIKGQYFGEKKSPKSIVKATLKMDIALFNNF